MTPRGEKITQNQLTIGVKLNKTYTLENIEIITNLGIRSTSLKTTGLNSYKDGLRLKERPLSLNSEHHGSQGATLMSIAALCKESRASDHMGVPRFLQLHSALTRECSPTAHGSGVGLRLMPQMASGLWSSTTQCQLWKERKLSFRLTTCFAFCLFSFPTFPPGSLQIPDCLLLSSFPSLSSALPLFYKRLSLSLLTSSGPLVCLPLSASSPFSVSISILIQALFPDAAHSLPNVLIVSAEHQNHQLWRK